jgi:hypothetical protein
MYIDVIAKEKKTHRRKLLKFYVQFEKMKIKMDENIIHISMLILQNSNKNISFKFSLSVKIINQHIVLMIHL